MPKKKISPINEEFDFKLLVTIARKNSIALALILLISVLTSVLILRYTPPVFEATSVLQLTMENQAKRILNANSYQEIQDENKLLASSIELIRSKVMIARTIEKLPLDISYFAKGEVLTNELYKQCPFEVSYQLKDSSLLEKAIQIEFPDRNNFKLSYPTSSKGGASLAKTFKTGVWIELPEVRLKVIVKDFPLIERMQEEISSDLFYFEINSPSNVIDYVMRNLRVSTLNPQAQTVAIQFKDGNSLKACEIVNGIANEFNNYDLEKNSQVAERILQFIDNTIGGIDRNLRESEEQIEKFQRDNSMVSTEGAAGKVLNDLDKLESEIYTINKELFLFEKIKDELNNETELNSFVLSLSGSFENNELREQLKTMQRLLEDRELIRLNMSEKSDAYQNLQLKLTSQRNMLIRLFNNEQARLNSQKNYCITELKKKEKQLGLIPGQQAESTRLNRIYGVNEKFYSLLLEKKAEFSITKAGYVPQHVIFEEAKPNKPPVSPKKNLVISACLAAGFLLGFLLILIKYLLYNEINSLEEVGHYTDAALLGIVPKYKRDIPISQLLVDKNPKSIISESFRSIRTNLQFISYTEGAKLVAVTSTISGEGKTFNAINLAGVIAFSGKKVIILDLDMRKPKIHLGFNVENNHGMSTLLIGKDKPENCITKSSLANLDFITAGPIPPNPAELIIHQKMDDLIDHLKGLYEIIIIDLPPVGIVSDGIPILKRADYPIYILRANFSRKMFINQINKLIQENKVNNLSVILNGVEMSRIKYGYGYGYSYGYGYGYGYSYGYGYYEDDEAPKTFLGWVGSRFSSKKSKS